MPTFTWLPRSDATREVSPRVKKAAFGDGYSQRVGDGINSQPITWSLEFPAPAVDAEAVEAFLSARAGVESFDWTDPDGLAAKWLCDSWSSTKKSGGIAIVRATFTQVFGE